MGRAKGQVSSVALQTRRPQDHFSNVLGEKRGLKDSFLGDEDWRIVYSHANRENGPEFEAHFLELLSSNLQSSAKDATSRMLRHIGVSSDTCESIVCLSNRTLHIPQQPLGEQDHVHPTSLCGRLLNKEKIKQVHRGEWGRTPAKAKRCAKCLKASTFNYKAELDEDINDIPPFLPKDQKNFETNLDRELAALVKKSLEEHLSIQEVETQSLATYNKVLLEEAVAVAQANKVRVRKKAIRDEHKYGLEKEFNYPADIDEVLVGVDWAVLFEDMLPETYDDEGKPQFITGAGFSHVGEKYRKALIAQITILAKERAPIRRLQVAQEKVSQIKKDLAQAELELADADQAHLDSII